MQFNITILLGGAWSTQLRKTASFRWLPLSAFGNSTWCRLMELTEIYCHRCLLSLLISLNPFDIGKNDVHVESCAKSQKANQIVCNKIVYNVKRTGRNGLYHFHCLCYARLS